MNLNLVMSGNLSMTFHKWNLNSNIPRKLNTLNVYNETGLKLTYLRPTSVFQIDKSSFYTEYFSKDFLHWDLSQVCTGFRLTYG